MLFPVTELFLESYVTGLFLGLRFERLYIFRGYPRITLWEWILLNRLTIIGFIEDDDSLGYKI